ncbi:MAG: peptidylprolyl isomerase [Defluviitaleaceae bacterium]|nr:peptidylprolyl isomerase [Defluviitaleaceae bacterium]
MSKNTKKYRKPQPSRTLTRTEKKPEPKALDKKWIAIGAAALAVVVLFTVGLIWFYGETVVARIDGTRIRENDVRREIASDPTIQQWMEFGAMTWNDAAQTAANQLALASIYINYANQNDITVDTNVASHQVIASVINAIVADASLFTAFEAHLPEDPVPAAEIRANEILDRVQAGEDFDMLVEAYSDDGMPPEGYAFTIGAMVEEFCEAARDLEIGEVSGLVQTQFGFHIIKRIEPPEDPAFIMTQFGQVPPPLETDDEIFGAKHILVMAENISELEGRQRAVRAAFDQKFEAANLVLLDALDNIQP